MNADGTIAGAQGLNLTDGSGRMIPVNLSVSIPMSSLTQLNRDHSESADQQIEISQVTSSESIYSEPNNVVVDILPERSVTPGQSSSGMSVVCLPTVTNAYIVWFYHLKRMGIFMVLPSKMYGIFTVLSSKTYGYLHGFTI